MIPAKKEIFPFQECGTCGSLCACGEEERALRHIANRTWLHGPMTPEQREWCVQEADSAAEGGLKAEDLRAMTDRDLASDTLGAWNDYVRSHF